MSTEIGQNNSVINFLVFVASGVQALRGHIEENKDELSVFFCFPILLEKENTRDQIRNFLEKKGIESRTTFRPMSKQPYFEKMFGKYLL